MVVVSIQDRLSTSNKKKGKKAGFTSSIILAVGRVVHAVATPCRKNRRTPLGIRGGGRQAHFVGAGRRAGAVTRLAKGLRDCVTRFSTRECCGAFRTIFVEKTRRGYPVSCLFPGTQTSNFERMREAFKRPIFVDYCFVPTIAIEGCPQQQEVVVDAACADVADEASVCFQASKERDMGGDKVRGRRPSMERDTWICAQQHSGQGKSSTQ